MNSWQNDLLVVEKNNIDTRLAIEKSLEMHSKFLIQIYHEHYLLRKSINKNATFSIINSSDLKNILRSDPRVKDLFSLSSHAYDTYIECKKFNVTYSFDKLYGFTTDRITPYFLIKLYIKNNLLFKLCIFIFIIAILTTILNIIGFI
jgi:hypothetical protein